MSRTDKDMSYELRLEDELAPKASGRNKSNAELYIGRRWLRDESELDKYPNATESMRYSDKKVMYMVHVVFMAEWRRTYGSKWAKDSKLLARRNARRTQKHYLAQHYSSIDYDVDIERDWQLGTKGRGLGTWWW